MNKALYCQLMKEIRDMLVFVWRCREKSLWVRNSRLSTSVLNVRRIAQFEQLHHRLTNELELDRKWVITLQEVRSKLCSWGNCEISSNVQASIFQHAARFNSMILLHFVRIRWIPFSVTLEPLRLRISILGLMKWVKWLEKWYHVVAMAVAVWSPIFWIWARFISIRLGLFKIISEIVLSWTSFKPAKLICVSVLKLTREQISTRWLDMITQWL